MECETETITTLATQTEVISHTITNTLIKPTTIVTTVDKPTTLTNTVTRTTTFPTTITLENDVTTTSLVTKVLTETNTITSQVQVPTTIERPGQTIQETVQNTVHNTIVNTVSAPANVQVITIERIVTVPVTVPPVTVTATSLSVTPVFQVSLCPTPSAAILEEPLCASSNRTWGCLPGYICNMRKPNGCNFWPGLPSPDFVCPPENCMVAPPYTEVEWKENSTYYYPPSFGYFYLDPEKFGLPYDIFEFSTYREVHGCATTTITTGNWHGGHITPRGDAPCTATSGAVAVETHAPLVKKAEIEGRAFASAGVNIGGGFASTGVDVCYSLCVHAVVIGQYAGKNPAICEPNSFFMQAVHSCTKCINDHPGSGNVADYAGSALGQWVHYCQTLPGNNPPVSQPPDRETTAAVTFSSMGNPPTRTSAAVTVSAGGNPTDQSTPPIVGTQTAGNPPGQSSPAGGNPPGQSSLAGGSPPPGQSAPGQSPPAGGNGNTAPGGGAPGASQAPGGQGSMTVAGGVSAGGNPPAGNPTGGAGAVTTSAPAVVGGSNGNYTGGIVGTAGAPSVTASRFLMSSIALFAGLLLI